MFGVGSQKHFATAGWAPPKRCAPCRETKKVAHAVTVTATTETFIVGDVVIPLA
jgi:hypothetical protein